MVVALWVDLCSEVYSLYRADRSAQLRGSRTQRFDGRGVHPISWCWGQIDACAAVVPVIEWAMFATGDQIFSPKTVRAAAYKEAERDYAAEIIRNNKEAV